MNAETLVAVLEFSGIELSVVTVAVALFGFWVWMLVDCAKRIKRDVTYLCWLIFIALTYFVGALAYFFFGRRSDKVTI